MRLNTGRVMKQLQNVGATSLTSLTITLTRRLLYLMLNSWFISRAACPSGVCLLSSGNPVSWLNDTGSLLSSTTRHALCVLDVWNPYRNPLGLSNESDDWIFKHLIKFSFYIGGYAATWRHLCLSSATYLSACDWENGQSCFPQWTWHSGLWGATNKGTGRI